MTRKPIGFSGYILMFVAIGLLFGGSALIYSRVDEISRDRAFHRNAVQTEAKILKSGGTSGMLLTITFNAQNGRQVTTEIYGDPSDRKLYEAQDAKMTIRYLPDDPDRVTTSLQPAEWSDGIATYVAGAILLACAALAFRFGLGFPGVKDTWSYAAFGLGFAGFGVILCSVQSDDIAEALTLLRTANRADARVISSESRGMKDSLPKFSSNTRGARAIVVSFATPSGPRQARITACGGSYFEPNNALEVLYDPKNPDKAFIMDFKNFWLGAFGLFAFGVILSLAGIILPFVFVRLFSGKAFNLPTLPREPAKGQNTDSSP